jgi:hypothetical protein
MIIYYNGKKKKVLKLGVYSTMAKESLMLMIITLLCIYLLQGSQGGDDSSAISN